MVIDLTLLNTLSNFLYYPSWGHLGLFLGFVLVNLIAALGLLCLFRQQRHKQSVYSTHAPSGNKSILCLGAVR